VGGQGWRGGEGEEVEEERGGGRRRKPGTVELGHSDSYLTIEHGTDWGRSRCDAWICYSIYVHTSCVYCTVQCTVQYYTVQYCIVLYSAVLYCIVQCSTVLYCAVQYSIVLYCTVLYCTVL